VAHAKRKAETQAKQRNGKKTRRADPNEKEPEGGSDLEPEVPRSSIEVSQKGRRGTKGVGPRAEKGTGSSGWAERANKFLTNAEYGSKWVDVLALWWKREEDAGFEGTVSKAVQLLSTVSGMT
jgi:hypothetical protein